jgi:predicted enzyme related to lactoylglutathione lyase
MSTNTEKVTGIGGVFFRARDPVAMAAWYRDNLGIPVQDGYADLPWSEKSPTGKPGSTVWSVFPDDTDYFGSTRPAFMINYRVADLDKMLAQLRANGVAVEKVEDFDYGRFAWLTDPEGNRIELYQPLG